MSIAISSDQNSPKLEQNKGTAVKYTYNRNKSKEPKRNKSAFVFFSNHTRAKLKAEGTYGSNPNEMMIKLAELWRNLPQEQKKPFEDQAHKDKLRYFQELEAFWKDNPLKPLLNKTKKNHVKKPCSAYGLFLKDVKDDVKALNPGLKMADILRIISQKWKHLDQARKASYQNRAKRENEEARNRLSEHHHSKNVDEEEDLSKKRAMKQQIVRRKLQNEGLPVTVTDTEQLTIPEISYDQEGQNLFHDDALILAAPTLPDFGSVSDFFFNFEKDSDPNSAIKDFEY